MSVFPFSIILNAKSCPNSAPTNVYYNWNTDANNFAKKKITVNQEKQSREKKRKGKEEVGDKRDKRTLERGEVTNERCEVGDAGQLLSDNKKGIIKTIVAGTRCEQEISDLQ